MPKQAVYLYKAATGSFPTSGQSLKTALGASSGDKVSDWLIDSWLVTGANEPSSSGGPYADGWTFSGIGTTIDGIHTWAAGGSGRTSIMRSGTSVSLLSGSVQETADPGNAGGASITITACNIKSDGTLGSMSFQINGPAAVSCTVSLVGSYGGRPGWYTDTVNYPYPTFPLDNGSYEVGIEPTINSSVTSINMDMTISYAPDNGQFNPSLIKTWTSIPCNTRSRYNSEVEWEWHSNSSYTSLVTSARILTFMSINTTDVTYWLRWRFTGASTWNNWGSAHWVDPRP